MLNALSVSYSEIAGCEDPI